MKKIVLAVGFLVITMALPALAANRFILRPVDDTSVSAVCGRHGLTVVSQLDSHNSVFLVDASDIFTADSVISDVSSDIDVTDIEADRPMSVPETIASAALNQSTTAILDQISDRTVVSYFGQTVPAFYAAQPAISQLNLAAAQQLLGSTASPIVAIIDTGIDPNHPILKASVVPGFDFTRNIAGSASEFADLAQSTTAILDQSTTAILDQSTTAILDQLGIAILNQSTTAILDQSTTAILDTSQLPAAFGHGTMVAGIIHLAAPNARLMPLKAFTAAGTGDLADILRAIYYAADHGASVINMSFSLDDSSAELTHAIGYAHDAGAIAVASTGNTGLPKVAFPAGAPKTIGVGSVDATGQLSAFSSFGSPMWVVAPGENIVTTYPGNHWAVVSGTSFSAPFVAGGTALMKGFQPLASYSNVSKAFSLKRRYSNTMGFGNTDLAQSASFLIGKGL
jgi:hypothetical protein